MRALFRSSIAGLMFSLLLAGSSLAKGEEISAVIGPIDDLQAGTPTAVPVELTENGHPVTRSDTPAYLSFFEPVSRDVVDFPLRYDRAAGTHVAQITLPHEGRWLVEGVMRWDATTVVAFGRSSGTRIVTVGPAAASNPEATPIGPAVLGAAASAAWLLGLASYALRRRRQTARFTSQDPLPEAG